MCVNIFGSSLGPYASSYLMSGAIGLNLPFMSLSNDKTHPPPFVPRDLTTGRRDPQVVHRFPSS